MERWENSSRSTTHRDFANTFYVRFISSRGASDSLAKTNISMDFHRSSHEGYLQHQSINRLLNVVFIKITAPHPAASASSFASTEKKKNELKAFFSFLLFLRSIKQFFLLLRKLLLSGTVARNILWFTFNAKWFILARFACKNHFTFWSSTGTWQISSRENFFFPLQCISSIEKHK